MSEPDGFNGWVLRNLQKLRALTALLMLLVLIAMGLSANGWREREGRNCMTEKARAHE